MTDQVKPCPCGDDGRPGHPAGWCPNAEPAPAPCDHVWGDPQNRDGTLKTCQKCGIGGAPAPGYVAPVSIPGSADQEWDKSAPTPAPASVTPASDEEVASVEPNIAKTAWETCSNCDAGLRSINVPPYLEGTHEDYCILTMWPKVIARIEHEQAANAELRAGQAAFVEMNAVFEAVMRAIRGEPLSEFDLSHGAVYEAQMLREANNAHARITADLRARLAEVSQAAMAVVSNSDMATPPTIAAMAALEAILAKGDKS